MKSIFRLYLILLLFIIISVTKAQQIAIGEWRDHLPYNNCVAVAEAGSKIYCATNFSLFYYEKTDNSIQRLTKINGLSDFGVQTIKYSSKYKILLVAYTNTNIDIIDGQGQITNFSDIKRKQILGNKLINKISIIDDYAYLSCSFGIVVFNLKKQEINDTYYIGQNGKSLNVFDFTTDNVNYYAATATGIYYAPVTGQNLADFSSWKQRTDLPYPGKKYNAIAYFHDRIYANQSNNGYNSDSLFVYDGSSWQKMKNQSAAAISNIEISYDNLIISASGFIDVFDNQNNLKDHIYQYNPGVPQAADAIYDKNLQLWVADRFLGLATNFSKDQFEDILAEGPLTNNVLSMALQDGNLWVTTGGKDDTWNNIYSNYGIYHFSNDKWASFTKENTSALDTVFDYISAGIDPSNSSNAYIGTWSKGLIWFKNNEFYRFYDASNSSLKPYNPTVDYSVLRVGGITFDADNNMWVTNPGANNPLSVKMPGENGKWQSFHFYDVVNTTFLGNIIIDNYNQKWVILPRAVGVLVFNDNGTISQTSDDVHKILTGDKGHGNLPSTNVFSIANDLEGQIWIGTDQGVAVIYSPSNVFTNQDFDAQQILLQQDGHWQYLLQTEIVTAIAVDGANRKWLGTQNSGVYLMSADGTNQILHFTTDNSPLFSNTISSIAIDNKTGEVYFGTSNGIISYKGTATEGKEDFSDKSAVYAYPNPVKEGYEGPIAIKGLVTNADVKITSINGNLVYSTKALGGQAVWNGRNFDGSKSHTGVYLVFCSNDDGSQTIVTKILIIN